MSAKSPLLNINDEWVASAKLVGDAEGVILPLCIKTHILSGVKANLRCVLWTLRNKLTLRVPDYYASG